WIASMVWSAGMTSFSGSTAAPPADQSLAASPHDELTIALPAQEWRRVDRSVDRALAWLAAQQDPDGSFPTIPIGQPAVTSLAVMAFLSDGHQPGAGQYGERLNRAIDFVLDCQQPTGIFSFVRPEPFHIHLRSSHAASYNHAIAGLMLTEAYGQVTPERSERIAAAVHKALRVTLRLQVVPVKTNAEDRGGWRYLWKPGAHTPSDSDLSVTGWHLMFLRSAKNAQFEIPDAAVAEAVRYVERCYEPSEGGFVYGLFGPDRLVTRSTMGIGALSLALGGEHQTVQARRAGEWLLEHPFDTYGATTSRVDRFHYGAYYCSNAMAQLGGKYWRGFFPPLAKTLLDNQLADGSWPAETNQDAIFGSSYSTALSVLALTPAYQLLPIYQR
ncbi:MAG: prenyltransferase/squalene oxidase repeat-containing protein, partial [Pirellulales bacterium]